MGEIKHKPVGEQLDSTEWVRPDIHIVDGGGSIVTSSPVTGGQVVSRMYYDDGEKELVIYTGT